MKKISDLLFAYAGNAAAKVIVDETGSYSVLDIARLARADAKKFRAAGVKTGERIIFQAENSVRLLAAIMGAVRMGAVACPIHPATGRTRLKNIIEDATPALLVTDEDRTELYAGMDARPAVIKLGASSPLLPSAHAPAGPVAGKNVFALVYTSGSAGRPMGVMLGHRQALFAVGAICDVLRLNPGDSILSGLPLSFDYGLYQFFLALKSGATLVLRRNFDYPMAVPGLLARHGITVFPAIPSLLAVLLRSRLLERVELPSLKLITSTGDVLPAGHVTKLKKILPGTEVVKMYGLTECKRVSVMPRGMGEGREDSVGLPLPGTEVKIIDNEGRPVGPGRTGELVVIGPHVMDGYWNAPKETARRFAVGKTGEAGELRTGDLFSMDDDGFLRFVARKTKIIKTSGMQASPAEIENFLCSLDGVTESAVLGIQDGDRGRLVCAALSVGRESDLDGPEIRRLCAYHLAPHLVPAKVVVTKRRLPKTENGKINRKMIRSFF